MNDNNVATIYFRYQKINRSLGGIYRNNHPTDLRSMQKLRDCGYHSWVSANGGYTVVIVRNPQTNRYHIGVARCSDSDRFQRKTGREKALQYAMQAQEQDKKISYPEPHGKRERAALGVVLTDIPMRFLLDDDTIRNIDPYNVA